SLLWMTGIGKASCDFPFFVDTAALLPEGTDGFDETCVAKVVLNRGSEMRPADILACSRFLCRTLGNARALDGLVRVH
ncbi:hypothetical protein, partial [Pseudomonas fluorescens]|uniref:hypothetical protein n=1 Tax=Pseudomonas fluorescens TaxID=294 RepID=UPI001C630CF5